MSVVLDNTGTIPIPGVVPVSRSRPPMLRNHALMDAIFRNLTRFFAFAAAALKVASSGETNLPALFWTWPYASLFCLAYAYST